MIRDVFCCFKKVSGVVSCIFCNNGLQGEKSSRHDVIIEYKEADYEHTNDTNEDDYSVIESKDDTTEVHIPYIDDNVSEFIMGDVETQKNQDTPRKEEKVKSIFSNPKSNLKDV